MLKFRFVVSAFILAGCLFAQSDRGTLTGTVTDPGGAVISGAEVVARNPENGVESRTLTTDTGNYTIPSLSSGTYNVSVTMAGFRSFQQTGVRIQVATTSRVDVALQIGASTESVTISGDAAILKTESAEQSTTLTGDTINQLPLNFSTGAGAVRNPLQFVQLSPGASVGGWNDIRVNGAPSNTFRIIFEGQDTTSALNPRVSDESQPSVESIQEFTLQTSNYSAEFGQVSGGLFNFTSRSGTNQFHGSGYEYLANEAFNASRPIDHQNPQIRRHDFGGSIGGPVWIPKVYNGRNKTFFFFNFEMFRDRQNQYYGLGNVPTAAFRAGDFSSAITGRQLGIDPLGRPIIEGTIYDPATTRVVGGQVVRDPFPGNMIPTSRLDPVSLKVQSLIPTPTNGSLVNNFDKRSPYRKIQAIPSIKIDHTFGQNHKLAGYYSQQRTDKDNGQDGLPDPISKRRDQLIRSYTTRLNYDWTIAPTLLLHTGAGYQRYHNPDSSPDSVLTFDSISQLGLKGAVLPGFPVLTDLNSVAGGIDNLGPTNRSLYLQDKPTAVASVTWIRGNHSYKFGGEWRLDTFTNRNTNGVAGNYGFSGNQTTLPSTQGQNLQGGYLGLPYASFLLGLANSASISNPQDPQYRRTTWGFFAQDTWKLSRKLTLDYGLRYDVQPPAHELYHRTSIFSPSTANPNAGGRLGATVYEGDGAKRCNCTFAGTYPWAFAPRLGLAYQVNPKTVFRAAWGLSYGQLTGFNYIGGGNSQGFGFNTINFTSPAFGDPAAALRNGLNYDSGSLFAASLDPGLRVVPGRTQDATAVVDPNGGRPPRVSQWSIGLQREVAKSLVVEAAYVGNRGAWFRNDSLVNYNAISEGRLNSFGLNLNNAADRTLLTSRLDSSVAQARGFSTPPYPGFPTSATVAQSLRPYPQFNTVPSLWAPLGNNWYDSLQVKATKRYSAGLTFTAAYTWSKTLTNVEDQDGTTSPINDVFNRQNQKSLSRLDQPHVFVTSFTYQVPFGTGISNRILRAAATGWMVNGIFRYASGFPIQVPDAQSALNPLVFQNTRANRVAGQPLFLKNPNCHCIDWQSNFVLNPAAWSDPAPGQFGVSAPYYSDYRYQRRYDEQLSFGKAFRFRERMSLQVRAEFFNILNRSYYDNFDRGNAQSTQRFAANGTTISGFGRINPTSIPSGYGPRSGQLVARFEF